jgi:hypothetical protein
MKSRWDLWLAAAAIVCVLDGNRVSGQEPAPARAPVIKHDPVLVGAPGQSITIRAIVTDVAGAVKSATLLYSTSRDVAPFRLSMQLSGADTYLATVPGALLTGARQVLYYIEAVNGAGETSETKWYTIELQPPPAELGDGSAPPVAKTSSWKKPALYAGGAAVLIGAGIWAATANKDDDGGSSSGGSVTNAGTYAGDATTYLQMSGSAPTSESHAMRILITSDGVVSSDSLRQGVYVEGRLSGSDFALVSPIAETNRTGEIRYEGTVLNGRITGAVHGSVRDTDGATGTYSGTFNATRQ